MGYAQAEDRLEEILKQYRRAEGTMAEVFGPEHLRDDYRQRLWQHRAVAEANYDKQSPKIRAIIEAYQAGLKQYMKEHPQEVPAWAPELHPWQIVALGRYIIWGWPEGEAAGDLKLRRHRTRSDPRARIERMDYYSKPDCGRCALGSHRSALGLVRGFSLLRVPALRRRAADERHVDPRPADSRAGTQCAIARSP